MKTAKPFSSSLSAALVLSAFWAHSVQSAEFYPITDIVSDTAGVDYFVASNLIEGAGVGFASDPPHAAAGSLTWVTNDANGSTGDYFDPVPDPAPRLVFDLGENVSLAEISVWAYPISGNALKNFSLRFATDAEGPDGFGSSITFHPEYEALTAPGPRQGFMFGQRVTARYVEFTPLDNYFEVEPPGGDRVGMSEVAFEHIASVATPKADLPATRTLAPTSSPVTFSIPVRNIGHQALTLGAGSFTGANAAAFTIVNQPSTIPPLSAASVTVTLSPLGLAPGDIAATVSFPTNDPGLATASVAITATIPPIPADVFHPIAGITSATSGTDYFNVQNLIEGIGIGFNSEQPHDQRGTNTWVTDAPNGGTADYFDPLPDPTPLLTVDLGSNVILTEISVWGYSLGNANGMSDFSLRFATDAEGPEGANSIAYNPTFVVPHGFDQRHSFWFSTPISARYVLITPLDNYFGTGTAPGGDRVGAGEIAFAIMPSKTGKSLSVPGRVDFPLAETARNFELVLRNTGSEAVAVSGFQLTGSEASSFGIVSAPASIAAHSQAVVTVSFDPETTNSDTSAATLNLQSDDPALPSASIPITAKASLDPVEFYTMSDVISVTVDTDYYTAYNLIEGIGAGFSDVRPHVQTGSATWVTDAPNGGTGDYFNPVPEPAPKLTFDLGENVPLDEISVWGYTFLGNSVSDFSLRFATDAEGPDSAGASIAYNPTFTAAANNTQRQSFRFAQAVTARYVELTPLDNYFGSGEAGGDRAGLGEVAFRVASAVTPPLPSFAISSITRQNGQVTLTFQSVASGVYNVYRSTNLASWTPVASNISGLATSTNYTDTTPPAAPTPVFYRVERTR